MSAPRVRVYGYRYAESSFGQVTRGICRALACMGELAGLYALDDEDGAEGAEAPIGLCLGPPSNLIEAHRSGAHRSHWLLLAPNGDSIPQGVIDTLTCPSAILPCGLLTGGLLAPSSWAAEVLHRAMPGRPVIFCPHGVTASVHRPLLPLRRAARASYEGDRFSVLHMTSTETERKGTRLLLRAWREALAELPRDATLRIVMNPAHTGKVVRWCSEHELPIGSVEVLPGLAYTQAEIASAYSSSHVVCQPSRGEGFGLVPLEALACGVPVIATLAAGHSEALHGGMPGLVVVPHGPSEAMSDFAGSRAPSVEWQDIRHALLLASRTGPGLADAAGGNSKRSGGGLAW